MSAKRETNIINAGIMIGADGETFLGVRAKFSIATAMDLASANREVFVMCMMP